MLVLLQRVGYCERCCDRHGCVDMSFRPRFPFSVGICLAMESLHHNNSIFNFCRVLRIVCIPAVLFYISNHSAWGCDFSPSWLILPIFRFVAAGLVLVLCILTALYFNFHSDYPTMSIDYYCPFSPTLWSIHIAFLKKSLFKFFAHF